MTPDTRDQQARIAALEQQVKTLTTKLRTLIVWIAQSAGAPISHENARQPLDEVGEP